MAQSGRGDPGVVPSKAATSVLLGRGDAGEAACHLGIDWQQGVGGLNSREGREADRASNWVDRSQNAQLKLGCGDH